MFDRELMRGVPIDLAPETLYRHIVSIARYYRREETAARAKARLAETSGENGRMDVPLYRARRDMAREMMTARMATVLPLREAIVERTIDERMTAEEAVRSNRVQMAPVVCSGETCGDCDYPIWWHVDLGGTYLCPLGREYWTYLRAVFPEGKETMRMIARETGRGAR